ncbi:MAG TPA: SusC/RagA family TonB-linked outer membrane protein [Chryseosolibacter sp.]
MKNALQKYALFRKIMKFSLGQLIILSIMTSVSFAGITNAQEMLNKKLTLNIKNESLKGILRVIESKADVRFAYTKEAIGSLSGISIVATDEKLSDVLDRLLTPYRIRYEVVGGQIILSQRPNGKDNLSGDAGSSDPASADELIVGKVTDEQGGPIPGVNVVLKGTTIGTVTDADGRYSLGVPALTGTLVFSYIGFTSVEEAIGGRTTIDVTLSEDVKKLESVVVIGYGTATKSQMVGAASVVHASDAGATTITNPAQLLIGKAAGVQVLNSTGVPGSNPQIIIRGTGSFTSVDPLYVIDGIQASGNLFNALAPQDIESITVLKDASSTAIYGAAAANGVVIVTTKKIRGGAPRISVTSQVGTSHAWKKLDLLNASQYVELMKDYAAAKGVAVPAKLNTPEVNRDVTDWQDQIFRNALSTENDVSISGGSEKVLYNLSLGYVTQQATVKDYEYKRVNSRFSLDENLGRFHFGQSLNVRYSKSKGQILNLFFGGVTTYPPYQPIYDSTVMGGYSIVSNVNDLASARNPMQALGVLSNKSDEYVLFPEVFGEVDIVKGLSFRSQVAATYGGGSNSSFQKAYTSSNFIDRPRQASMGLNNYFTYTFENYFSYQAKFDKHDLSATVGTSYIDAGFSNGISETGTNIANDNIQNTNVALVKSIGTSNQGYGTLVGRTKSYYGRLIYSYNDKYTLSGSVRRDGSSNFGPNNRYGNFYGAGLAWNFSEENFIKNSLPFVSDGNLRIGWGRTGNNRFGLGKTDEFAYSGTPAGTLVYSFGPNEGYVPGTTLSTVSNPNLRWEDTEQTDAGIDLGFLNNRLTLTVDWYNRKSSGLLVNVPLPASSGILGVARLGNPSIITNAADVQNKGVEVSLGYQNNVSEDFGYHVGVNFSANKNTTLALGQRQEVPIKDGNINGLGTITYTAKGSPIGSFYGYRVDHVATDQAEIDALNESASSKTGVANTVFQNGLLPGDFIFKDLNGDGIVDSKDQEVLGNPIPKYIYGFNAGVNFKRFDLNLVISGLAGLKLVNATKYYTESVTEAHNTTTALLDRWRQPGDVASLPRAGQNASNLRPSDFYIEDGSYLRVRNLTLGYTFSQPALADFTNNVVRGLRFYVAAQNLLTLTDYSGYDPEVSTQSAGDGDAFIFRRGIDTGQLPQPRTFLAGVQLQF